MILTPRGETMSGRDVPWFAVINLGNSIIGVSILAMPWCFRECGVVLATLLIIFGGFMTRLSCNLLLRASKATRRQSYEYLAYHTLGATGKLAVEMSIIGMLVCTCIAFFVIMGDLGPAIVSKWGGFENNWELRVSLLVFMAAVIVLPLGLRRSIESLSNISTISIMFYILFSSDIILNSLPVLTSGTWTKDLVLWRSAGTLKGLSIFALAFSCQTILFVVYDSLPVKNPFVMEAVVSRALKMVGVMNILVGFFGYVTFNQTGIKGDILLNFAPGLVSEVLRLGFTLSVALSFPLCIFPCRASIYTLFFSHAHSLENPHGVGGEYIPPSMFKLITLILVVFTLILGITIPNVEVILGLTGATLGCLICFIFPALIYLRTTGVPNKGTGKIVLVIGLFLLICSTYDNLQSMQKEADVDIPRLDIEAEVKMLEQAANQFAAKEKDKQVLDGNPEGGGKQMEDLEKEPNIVVDREEELLKPDGKDGVQEEEKKGDKIDEGEANDQPNAPEVVNEQRREPPIPHAPADKDTKAKPPEQVEVKEDQEDAGNEEKPEDKDDEDESPADKEDDKDMEKQPGEQGDVEEGQKEKEEEQEKPKAGDKEEEEEDLEAGDEDNDDGDKKVVEKVVEQAQRQEEHDKQLKEIKKDDDTAAGDGSIEKIVEDKGVEHDMKQDEQDQQLKELKKEGALDPAASLEKEHQEVQDKEIQEIKEKQEMQEAIIKQQAEELEKLRVQHEEEQKEKEIKKIVKEKEEKQKLQKEKEDLEQKLKQEKLLQQAEDLQRKQQELQMKQEIQQIQQQVQQQQQQPLGGGLGGGLGQEQYQQPIGGVQQQGGLGMDQGLPQQVAQDAGFGAPNLGVQQQPLQQAGMVDGLAGGLQQQQPVLDAGLMQPVGGQQQAAMQVGGLVDGLAGGLQQQQPVLDAGLMQPVGGQQQAAMQQPIVPQQPDVMQQQPAGGQLGQQLGVGGQMHLQDGGLGQGMLQDVVNQLPGEVIQQQQDGMGQPILDRQQRSIQGGMQQQLGQGVQMQQQNLQQQQVGGVPQQGGVDSGLPQMQQQHLQQQQNVPQQPVVPVQGQGQVAVNPDVGMKQQMNQGPIVQQQQQQQLNKDPIVQQQQVDQHAPVLGKKNLDDNLKPILAAGIDSNAANRQLKHTNTQLPKVPQKDQSISKTEPKMKQNHDHDLKEDFDKIERTNKNVGDAGMDVSDEFIQEEESKKLRVDGKTNLPKENKDHEVLVDDKEDVNMELANSLEQQMNNQFKQVGAIAQKEKTKIDTRRKEEVK